MGGVVSYERGTPVQAALAIGDRSRGESPEEVKTFLEKLAALGSLLEVHPRQSEIQ